MADGSQAVRVELVPLNQIAPDPNQLRKHFDEEALATLTESVRVHGVIQPIIVRPAPPASDGTMSIVPWWIIGGERRWRAAGRAGLAAIPATIREDLSDADVEVLQVIENLQRADLTLPETAAGVSKLVAAIGNEKAAVQLGMSEGWVSKHARLGELPNEITELVKEGAITSADMAHDLARLKALSSGVESYYINDALRNAKSGDLTRADLRSSILAIKSIRERREREQMERDERANAAGDHVANINVDNVDVTELDDTELAEFKESVSKLSPEKSESYPDLLARIEAEENSRKQEREEKSAELEREEKEREQLSEHLGKLGPDLKNVRLQLLRRLYSGLDMFVPEVDEGEPDALADDGMFAETGVYEIYDGWNAPIGIAAEIPGPYAVIRGTAVAPKSLEDCKVTLMLTLPLYRMRKVIDAVLGDNPAPATNSLAPPPSNETDKQQLAAFIKDCVAKKKGERIKSSDFYDAYVAWAKRTGRSDAVHSSKSNLYGAAIEANGIKKHRYTNGVHYLDVQLKEIA